MNIRKETNKELILGSLLEFPKTTGQLARELDYFDSKGNPDYGIIYKDLQKLIKSGYVESKRGKLEAKPGSTPTSYSILYKVENLQKMLKEFPDLIENMQSSELVLETVTQEKFNWISNSAEGEYVQIENLNLYKKTGKESWKEKLRLSQEFFRFCLNEDYIEMIQCVRSLTDVSGEYWDTNLFEYNNTSTSKVFLWVANYRIEKLFEACVTGDIVQRKVKKEAIEYLEQRKNEALEEQYQQLREFYNSIEIAPEFIKGKEFVSVENSKIREIEQEFLDNGGKYI
jgi:DNA-binding PadR family transcriptional regulator